MGWLGRQFSGARRGGPVTHWVLRAGISTHAAVSEHFPGLEKTSGALVKCIYAEFREESRGNDEKL